MATAVIDNVNTMSKYRLRRKPTYAEIIGMLDDNEKITGKLPNRDATFFKSSPEGSFFDGSDAIEQLREEQGKLLLRQMNDILLRQNVRTAGRTYHTERLQQGSAADSDPGPFITILIHVCLQCPTFCTFSFILEICTRAFCPIFCMGACPSCAICIVVAMQTSVFSAWARFRTLILDALQLFWPTHLPDSFYDSSETERIAHTAQAVQHLLCPILHECLTLWAHTFSVGATPDRAIVSNHPTLCPT